MVDTSCGGTFTLKNKHEAWQLFETLSEKLLQHMSTTRRDPPITGPKGDGMYEVGHSIDIYSKVDELSQKLDQILQVGHTSSLFA